MQLTADEKDKFWTKAFIAAISGYSSQTNTKDAEIAKRAASIADEALKIYSKRTPST